MKFKVSSQALLQRLQALSRVIVSKSTVPVLSTFFLEWDKERLSITATDGEIRLKSWLPIEEVEDEGSICIDTRILLEGVRGLSDQPIEFDINPVSDEITVRYDTGLFSFIGQQGDIYPKLPCLSDKTSSMEIETSLLLRKISKTIFATSTDELRPVMTGVYFEALEDSLNTVASDGHKLIHMREVNQSFDEKNSFIMSRKTGHLLKGLLSGVTGMVKLEFDSEQLHVFMEGFEMYARLITGRYPNYQAVIPKTSNVQVRVDRASFLSAIRRVACFSNMDSNLMKLVFDRGRIEVTAQDVDFSVSGNESIPCDYEGEKVTIGFKAFFLIELLSNIESQDVIVQLGSPMQPALFLPSEDGEAEHMTQLLMPMSVVD